MNNQNPIGGLLGNIQIPPITVKIDDESMRGLYFWGVLLMATGFLMYIVAKKAAE